MNNCAVVVTYEPDLSALLTLCASIVAQDFFVIIIDNSLVSKVSELDIGEKCHVISFKENKGVAYAQNIGIKYALDKEARILSFFDQDSVIPDGLLSKLTFPIKSNELIVTAPVAIDKISRLEYPSRKLSNIGLSNNVYTKNEKDLTPVDIVISSGVTTSAAVFKIVGLFDEDFFIDFVDVEWCLRCRENGVKIFVVPDAVMEHSIGENTVNLGPFKSILHSPHRTYYKVRNSILLLSKNVKILFVLRQILSAVIHNFFLVLYAKQRLIHIKFYFLGILHGILGKSGQYKE